MRWHSGTRHLLKRCFWLLLGVLLALCTGLSQTAVATIRQDELLHQRQTVQAIDPDQNIHQKIDHSRGSHPDQTLDRLYDATLNQNRDRQIVQTANSDVPRTTTQADQLVQQGVEFYQAGDLAAAIDRWNAALTQYQQLGNGAGVALVLENLARAYQQMGQTQQEVQYWQQAILAYQQQGDLQQAGRMMTEQAQAYSRLGQYRQAIALLCGDVSASSCREESALQIARTVADRSGEAAALGSLGDTYRLRGDYTNAIEFLSQSRAIAEEINHPAYLMSALNSLGNAAVSSAQINYRRAISATQIGDTRAADRFKQAGAEFDTEALEYFQQSLSLAQIQQNPEAEMRALLNLITPSYRTQDPSVARAILQQAIDQLQPLPDSQEKVYAAIDLANLFRPITADQLFSRVQCSKTAVDPQAIDLLQQAIAIAQRIGDQRSESFALGELGHVYECQGNYRQALEKTQQARWAAEQNLRAKDSLYLWEWQTGRILSVQGKNREAISVYEKAIATLETIRSDLLVANRDLQFDFRDTVDPVYRELIALRLGVAQSSDTPSSELTASNPAKENINFALKTLDSLKLSELQNYFGDDCVVFVENRGVTEIGQQNQQTVIFNSVVLDNRTAIIASFPDGRQQVTWINLDRNTLRTEINQYRIGLERFFDIFDPQQAEKLYGWIIAPFEDELEQNQIKTLVFVQDGILRSVPMSALYDGTQYLIQKYAIATTPSLTLTDPNPLDRRDLRALALGLTEAAQVADQSFPPLSNVNQEIQAIETELPGSKALINQDFTRDRLQQELAQADYPILHMATHGQFSNEPENTFLVTGDRQKLTLFDLDAIIRRTTAGHPIELLSLTACQTATGDDRAALGLAGVAIQAGVKSALASLWFVDDAATAEIATQFYANLLNPNITKAEALQLAQIKVIESNGQTAHPAFWAPFILIGNWL